MERIDGFINVDKMLNDLGIESTDISSLKNESRINHINNSFGIQIDFDYNGEEYFYKCNGVLPYNELVAEELAKDYGIPCASYDLAILDGKKGVISKDYKKKTANYISANDILNDTFNRFENEKHRCTIIYNNLPSIWTALDYRYRNKPNKVEITYHLMKQIANMFLFDIITCQFDRHVGNYEIMEEGDNINLGPLYDNEGILEYSGPKAGIELSISESGNDNLFENIREFQNISTDEFSKLIGEKLWIISEMNLISVFKRIEQKTNYPMPEEYKEYYFNKFRKHKERLEKALGYKENLSNVEISKKSK